MAPPSSNNSGGNSSASITRPPSQTQATKQRTQNFIKYPYPKTQRVLGLLETLPNVKEESRRCVANLLSYRAVRTHVRFPRGQSAGVLVPLFVGRSGDLYVVLSRRSDALSTYAGDTALPGGRIDAHDLTIEDTARREAFEEIGLPQDKERIPLLCVMETHLAKGVMLVTPVVVLILDNTLEPKLNSDEVTSIFAQPLVSFLSSTPYLSSGRTADPNVPYHTFTELPWGSGGTVRLHKFLTGREGEGVKPVFGLTASVLIKTATVGYGRIPEFEVQPANAPTPVQQIALALLTPTNPLRVACEREGIDANKTAARLLSPPVMVNAPRTIEWEKIGLEWKRLITGSNSARAKDTATTSDGNGPHSVPSGSLQKLVRTDDHVDDGDSEIQKGFDGQAEERSEQGGKEHRSHAEERQSGVPDMIKLGKLIDEAQDALSERMDEIKGNEKMLSKARNAYPKAMEEVKKQLEGLRNGEGGIDPKQLLGMIPRATQQDSKAAIETGREGIEQALRKKHDAKL